MIRIFRVWLITLMLAGCMLAIGMFLLLAWAIVNEARAGEAHLTWEHPTEYTDESPLPIEQIANTGVFYSTTVCDAHELLASPLSVIVQAPAAEVVIEDLGAGEWCFTARTMDTAGQMSAPSNVATKVIGSDPRSPVELQALVGTRAYYPQISSGRINLIGIGTLLEATPCDPDVAVADSNGVLAYLLPSPYDYIESFGGQEIIAAFGECGP